MIVAFFFIRNSCFFLSRCVGFEGNYITCVSRLCISSMKFYFYLHVGIEEVAKTKSIWLARAGLYHGSHGCEGTFWIGSHQ